MEGLLDLLNSPMGKQLISGVSQQTGEPENKSADVLAMAMPLLVGAMKQNAASPEGAASLMNALSSKHDGSALDNLDGFFGGGVDSSVLEDGAGILGHVFGQKQTNVENALGAKAGMDPSTIASILKIAAPLVMAYLGKQASANKVSDQNGMDSLLGNMMGGESSQTQSILTSLLDADGDGSMIDDVAGMVMDSSKKKGGLGGLLGGLFGK